MSDKRRGLGKGLGALIPSGPPGDPGATRPSDVFFAERPGEVRTHPHDVDGSTGNISPDSIDRVAPASADDIPADVPDGADQLSQSPEDSTREPGSERALGESDLAPVPGATFAEVPVVQIRPNPRQPRQVFDEDDLAELVHSVQEIGILQPIVVRPLELGEGEDGVAYELVMGERRWRATQEAGLETIPAIVRRTADHDLLRDALLENLHRAQLNPLEEAAAYGQLLEDFGCTHDDLASRIGRSRPQISNTLRLLKLPPLVQRRVAAGVLSAGHARALLGLADGAAMERLAQRIVAEGLSVRSVEEIVSMGGDQIEQRNRATRQATVANPQLDDLATVLSDRLDTRVAVTMGKRKGKLTVEFASTEDLERILDLVGLPSNPDV